MKWVLIVLVSLVVLVGIVVIVGYLLPRDHVASVTRRYAAPPDAIWSMLTNVEGFAEWRPDLKAAERQSTTDGTLRWREKTKHDQMTIEVTESVPPRRLVTRIADEGLPFGGTWTYDLKPDGAGTVLTITENGSVYNPIFRFVSRLVVGHTATMEGFHAGLERGLAKL